MVVLSFIHPLHFVWCVLYEIIFSQGIRKQFQWLAEQQILKKIHKSAFLSS